MPLLRDPQLSVDYSARLVAQGVLRPLFAADAGTGPGCATRASRLDGGRRWRVVVDDGLRWSDGRRLHAEDLAAGLTHAVRGRAAGVRAFISGADAEPPIRIVDPVTVEYRFDRPVAFATELLSSPGFAPRRPGVDRRGRPLSLGPFTVASWTPDRIVLERTGAGAGPARVAFVHVPSAAETVRRYDAGELDATSPTGFGVEQVLGLAGRTDVVSAPVDIFGSLDLGRRAPRSWLATAAARRAVSGLLDRHRFAAVTAELAEPWHWPGSAALGPGAPEDPTAPADRVTGPLDIAYADFAPNAELVTELAGQLGDAFGVLVSTTRLSFEDYVRATVSRDYCLLYSLTLPAFGHPAGSLSDWRSTGPAARRGGVADQVLDALLDAAESCPDPAAADPLWADVAARWCALLPRIPLVRVRAVFLRGRRLPGLTVTRSGLLACAGASAS